MKFSASALNWLEIILEERFGYEFKLMYKDESLHLYLKSAKGVIVFDHLQSVFHQSRSDFPCCKWKASSEGFTGPVEDIIPAPSEVALRAPLIELSEQVATVHYDILGLSYWLLTRLEEIDCQDLDNHQRFPATSSHAYQFGYLERPIVDEWFNILGQIMRNIWPDLKLKNHQFQMKVSHDVDRPSRYGFRTPVSLLRAMGGDIVKYRNFRNSLLAPLIRIKTHKKLHPNDPFNTFDWLMDISDSRNLKSAFYFICGQTHPGYDADYKLEHPAIRALLRRIHDRGHEIGLHPSYNTFQKPQLINQEFMHLKNICHEEGIYQEYWGGRMHFLRWTQPTTLQAWNDAGLMYDSTLSYADRAGFRCGTCFEYPAFNAVTQKKLDIRIRPLVVMECTIISKGYMGFGVGREALDKISRLINICRQVNGTFTLLWHNSELYSPELLSLYESVLSQDL